MDDDAVRQLNREGWNRRAEEDGGLSLAVDRETVAKARKQ